MGADMAKFTYIGVDGASDPKGTEAFGTYFPIGKAVEVSEPRIVAKLEGHPHFKAGKAKAETTDDEDEGEGGEDSAAAKLEAVKARGAKAKEDGKGRNVPPSYRGKPEEAAWLSGYGSAED